ncbi:MAG TPA: hypothetical protein VFJ46_25600, partial [Xanthobacteraceae bacterium]|nr:hypothetical protein [Xanthobacteraceae bacterium]
ERATTTDLGDAVIAPTSNSKTLLTHGASSPLYRSESPPASSIRWKILLQAGDRKSKGECAL